MVDYEFAGNSDSFANGDPHGPTWEACRAHREIITGILGSVATEGARTLCIFGAGPCNDVNLDVLTTLFQEVTLVDIDGPTLTAAVARQSVANRDRLKLLENVDLFGVSKLLDQYRETKDDSLLDDVIATVNQHQVPQLGSYDCVASTCLLSQLLCEASAAISEDHRRFVEVLANIRLRHIQLLYNSLNPGGLGVLVTDIVSSDSLPELLQSDIDVSETLRQAINNGNFLHGLNPAMVTRVVQTAEFAVPPQKVEVSDPWRWVMPERTYGCFAIKIVKSSLTPQ